MHISELLNNVRRRWISALAAVAGTLIASFLIHLPHGPEHWSADLRTAWLSDQLPSQHPDIAIVEVTENTLASEPYLSPMDRRILADLIATLDTAEVKAIGVDFLFDRQTEASKDEELIARIRDARTPIIVGGLDERTTLMPAQRAYLDDVLKRMNRPIGHLYFDEHRSPLIISDHVVRLLPQKSTSETLAKSFTEKLAETVGRYHAPKSQYIAWLLPPKDGSETFTTLSAERVLGGGISDTKDLLRGKIVLIGGNFTDRDRYLTPLSVHDEKRFTGVFIHAQMLAQLIDPHWVRSLDRWLEWTAGILACLLGALVGYRYGAARHHLMIEILSATVLILVTVLVFSVARLILPFFMLLLAWVVGSTLGQYLNHQSRVEPETGGG
jgi:CHASE2 domain-containing sensor protein